MSETPQKRLSIVKRVALFAMIGTYALSAGGAIVAIFWGDADWRIIGTTSLLGTFSLVVLGSLTVASMRYGRFLGFAAITAALVATLSTLGLIWGVDPGSQFLTHTASCAWVYASCLMFSSLAVAASDRAGRAPRILAVTATALNVLAGTLFTIVYVLVLGNGFSSDLPDGLWKSTLAVFVVSALAVVVCLTVALIQTATKKFTTSGSTLSSEATTLLRAGAAQHGLTDDAYLRWLLTLDPAPTIPSTTAEPTSTS